jgi:REP element-mobilizing transposase RayT
MWNDTDIPLAVFFSFRCYGTWLHGDPRGSFDRHNNKYKSPKYDAIPHWNAISKARLKFPPVRLNAKARRAVRKAIEETCAKRNWRLLAINIRTNHIHIVAAIGSDDPGRALSAFKANSTRQMRESGCWPFEHGPWSEKGSKRWLWNDRSVGNAVAYVLYGQGDDLPDFDA